MSSPLTARAPEGASRQTARAPEGATPELGRSGTADGHTAPAVRTFLREPLLHFLLLGSLLFLLHRWLAEPEGAAVISLDSQRRQELNALFAQRQGRVPSAAEQQQLAESWLDDELLFRESLRLDLASQDPDLREQMIAHMRALLQASVATRTPSQAELQNFFAAHRQNYQIPETISFVEYVLPVGPLAEENARALLRRLQAGETVAERPLQYRQSSRAQLDTLLTPELARKIMELPLGSWHQLRAREELHLVRLEARVPTSTPDFAALEEQLIVDLRVSETQAQMKAQLGKLRTQFRVQLAESP